MHLSLAPFAARVRFRSRREMDSGYWRGVMSALFCNIASRLVGTHQAVIGHIKGLAQADGSCLRANCVSARLGVDMEGDLQRSVKELDLDLAVLAYGVAWNDIRLAAEGAASQIAAAMACEALVEARIPEAAGHHHDNPSLPVNKPAKLISCKVMIDEIRPFLPAGMEMEAFDISLHVRPGLLRETLQKAIDAADGIYDPILLGYGLCSKSTVGLMARHSRLVVPKGDDCISVFLGSEKERRAEADKEPGTYFLTQGYIGGGTGPLTDYDRMVKKYGRQRADGLIAKMMGHYKRLVYIRMPNAESLESDRAYANEMAERFGLEYVERDGTSRLLKLLAEGQWGEDFVVTEPGQAIELESFMT